MPLFLRPRQDDRVDDQRAVADGAGVEARAVDQAQAIDRAGIEEEPGDRGGADDMGVAREEPEDAMPCEERAGSAASARR